jgi:hypothetical protein
MGDRALVIFKDETKISPVIYLHWAGSDVPQYIEELKALMADRRGDATYASARFTGIAHTANVSSVSLGLYALHPQLAKAIKATDAETLASFSHGDAGLIVVDARDFSWRAYGGYLESEG